MVAVGSRISDRCPLHLEDTWLDSCWAEPKLFRLFHLFTKIIPQERVFISMSIALSIGWVSIILLSVLLLLEVLADCIPAIASLQDGVMLLCKPALSAALALSPSYGHIYGISSGAGWLAAISAGLLAALVALMKAAWTLACDSGAAGLCSQVRTLGPGAGNLSTVPILHVLLWWTLINGKQPFQPW